jgi:uncharacterized protein
MLKKMSGIKNHSDWYENPEENKPLPPIEVPREALSDEALSNLIEAFILREGTDYGAHEVSYDTKASQVRKQLDSDDVKIVFDPNTETVTLLTTKQFQALFPMTKA